MALLNLGLLSPADKLKLKAKLQADVETLSFQITSNNIRKDKALTTATNIDSAITTQLALNEAYGTAKASQTPGSALYLEFEEKQTISGEKLAALNRQKAKFGTIAVVESESTIEVLQARIAKLNEHIAALS